MSINVLNLINRNGKVSKEDNDSSLGNIIATNERTKEKSLLLIGVIANIGISSFLVIIQLFLIGYTRLIAVKPASSFVQMIDGKSIEIEETVSTHRQPETIRKFVSDSFIYIMSWSNSIPISQPTSKFSDDEQPKDTGIEITSEEGKTIGFITTQAWQASFVLEEDFRKEFLQKLAQMTPNEVFAGQQETVLKVRNVTFPTELDEGRWYVDIVADLMIYGTQDPIGRSAKFNKRVYVRESPSPQPPDADTLSNLAIAIYNVRLSNLEVYKIEDLKQSLVNDQKEEGHK